MADQTQYSDVPAGYEVLPPAGPAPAAPQKYSDVPDGYEILPPAPKPAAAPAAAQPKPAPSKPLLDFSASQSQMPGDRFSLSDTPAPLPKTDQSGGTPLNDQELADQEPPPPHAPGATIFDEMDQQERELNRARAPMGMAPAAPMLLPEKAPPLSPAEREFNAEPGVGDRSEFEQRQKPAPRNLDEQLVQQEGALPPRVAAQPEVAGVADKFPALRPFLNNVEIGSGKPKTPDQQSEFYPPWESENPNPGKLTVVPYRGQKGKDLTDTVSGELLHYIGGVDPSTKRPVDPEYYKLKQAVSAARTPRQQMIDHRAYEAAVHQGERRPFNEWLDQSRLDEYIMGYVNPDQADEWRKRGFYDSARMKTAVSAVDDYLKSEHEVPTNSPQLKPAEPVRLSVPKPTPAPVEPITSGKQEDLEKYRAQALEDAPGMLGTAISKSDTPATRDRANRIHLALTHAQSVDEINRIMRENSGHLMQAGSELGRQSFEAPLVRAEEVNPQTLDYIAAHTRVPVPVLRGTINFAGGLGSPESLAQLYVAGGLGGRAVSAAFAGLGFYGSAKAAREAWKNHVEGNDDLSEEQATEAALNAGMGILALAHAADFRKYTGAYGEKGVKVGGDKLGAQAGYRPAYREPGPEGSYKPEEGSTVVPGKATASVTVAGRRMGTGGPEAPGAEPSARPPKPEPKELTASQPGENVPRATSEEPLPIGAVEPETGRPVLHEGENPAEIQAAATAEHPEIKTALSDLVSKIPGAKLAGSRDEKDADRLAEKIEEEGQSPQTARDYSGFRISVDTPRAAIDVANALKQRFEVHAEQNNFDKGDEENGFHGHTLNVREPGSDVSHEVQILPKEVAEAADTDHAIYEKARDGDKAVAAELRRKNEENWQRFQARQSGKTGGNEPETKPATRYEYGNTQSNIPDDSPAAKALDTFRQSIPEDQLAGDGKDVGSGGNHVTVRYGLQGDDTASIEAFLASQKPFTARLGPIEVFPPSKNSDGAAVLVARIEAPELTRMNAEIEKHGDFAKSDFPDYKPHATIAYVDPAVADQYKGRTDLAGAEFPIDSVSISDRNGKLKDVALKGATAGEGTASARTYEQVQRDIDAAEDRLEGSGQDVTKLYFPEHADTLSKAEGWKPMPKELVKLYAERDAIGSGQLKQSIAEIENVVGHAGVSDEAEMRRVLDYYGLDKSRTDAAKQYFAAEYTKETVDRDPKRQVADIYSTLAPLRDIFMDDRDDLWYDRKLTRDSLAIVKAVVSYFNGGQAPEIKGILPAESDKAAPEAGAVGRIATADLHFDPKRFQYKLNTDAGGTTSLLKGQRWNPDLAGVVSIWRDPADGLMYVVNGHHRAQLARESGVEKLNGLHLPAETAEEARATAALQNIAEGRGTPVDAAKFFRDTGLTAADLKEKGISLGEATAANGLALSRLDQSLFDKVVNGQMRIGRAIAIGNATEVPEQQEALLKLIQRAEMRGKRVSDDTVDELARMVKGSADHVDTQQTLFGAVEMRRNLALEKAEISAYIREEIGKEKRLFSTVADQGRATRLERGGNKIDAAQNAETAKAAAEAQELYDKLSTRTGAVDDILNQAAGELAGGKGNQNEIKRSAYEAARKALSEAFRSGEKPSAPGREPLPGSVPGTGQEAVQRSDGAAKRPDAGAPASPSRAIAKGDVVQLSDGRAGVVQYVTPTVNGALPRARVRLADGTMRETVKPQDMKRVAAPTPDPNASWIGVDVDKTLAHYTDYKGPEDIGKPIPAMVDRVKGILANGEVVDGKPVKDVRIFTARVDNDPTGVARASIEAWSLQHLGRVLPITNVKDPHMVKLYDDRAVGVEPNTGKVIGEPNAKNQAARSVETQRAEGASAGNNRRPGPDSGVAEGSVPAGAREPVEASNARGGGSGAVLDQPRAAADQGDRGGRARENVPTPGRNAGDGERPSDRGETAAQTQERLVARGRFEKELNAAQKRLTWENAAKAKVTAIQVHGVPAQVFDAAAYEALRKIAFPDEQFVAAFLDRGAASKVISRIRSAESNLRPRPGMRAAAEAMKTLALKLDGARESDGSVVILRADYDEPTVREELWHRWQGRMGLLGSETLRKAADSLDFEPAIDELKAIGYGELDVDELAAEAMAKALAGDPDWKVPLAVRQELARTFLDAVTAEHGLEALKDLPPVDPEIQSVIDEARGNERNQRAAAGSAVRGLGEADRQGVRSQGRNEGGAPGQAGRGERADAGGGEASEPGRPSQAELRAAGQNELFKRASQKRLNALRGEPVPFPGMENLVEEREQALASAEREAMEEQLRTPLGSIDQRAGEMEQRSPLFQGTEANPQRSLFKRKASETAPTWYLKSERLINSKMRGPMPANSLLKMLENNGVKPEELLWTGLGEFLRTKGTAVVRPAEVRDNITANNLQVHEVTKSTASVRPSIIQPADFDIQQSQHQYVAIDPNTGREISVGKGVVSSESAAREYLARYANNLAVERHGDAVTRGAPRFNGHTLPGGENYRELLLTLPEKKSEGLPALTADQNARLSELASKASLYGEHTLSPDEKSELDILRSRNRSVRDAERSRKAESFTSPHWAEPNVIGHVRFNDRTGPDGERLLHLEELQSDWHQKGRSKGYQNQIPVDQVREMEKRRDALSIQLQSRAKFEALPTPFSPGDWGVEVNGRFAHNIAANDAEDAVAQTRATRSDFRQMAKDDPEVARLTSEYDQLTDKLNQNESRGVPDAPFKKTWPELLLKRMVRYAAENGYDGISWTPGEQQSERYTLRKQIEELNVFRRHDGSSYDLSAKVKGGGQRDLASGVSPEKLGNFVGKEMAQRITSEQGQRDFQRESNLGSQGTWHTYKGLDLEVGGEGMKGFYDKILPDLANKVGKPFGAHVGKTDIGTETKSHYTYTGPERTADDVSKLLQLTRRTGGTYVSPITGTRMSSVAERANMERPLSAIQIAMERGTPFSEAMEKEGTPDLALWFGGEMKWGTDPSRLSVPYLPITSQMRDSVIHEGQPLFKKTAPERPPTTVTTGKHDTGRSLEDAVDELKELPKRKMPISERVELGSDKALEAMHEGATEIQKAFAAIKGTAVGAWDSWAAPAPWTDYLQSLGDLKKAELKAAMDVKAYQKELVRVAPSEREREAITVYGEAPDDMTLRRWADMATHLKDKPGGKRYWRAFQDALNLTPEQKKIAQVQRSYYDQQLKILTDAGLLPAGASHYVMHMFSTDPETLAKLTSVTDFTELSPNPSFLNRRVFKSYFEAIEEGENPKTMDAGRILSAYHDAFTKAFMTRGFIRSLLYGNDPEDDQPLAILQSRAGWVVVDKNTDGETRILKQPKRPEKIEDYVHIPASQLRNFTWELTDEDREVLVPGYSKMDPAEQAKLFGPDDPSFTVPKDKVLALKGDILIHPKYSGRVSDLVTKSWFDSESDHLPVKITKAALKGVGKAGSKVKSLILYGSGFHQVQLGIHAIDHWISPFKLPELKALAKDPEVQDGVGHGLGVTEIDPEGVLSSLAGMGSYHQYLFGDWIPRLKMKSYKIIKERNTKIYGGGNGKAPKMTRDEIALMSAQQTNAAFSGLTPGFFRHLNFMNNRTYKAVEHMVMFSPDFTKARVGFVAQGFSRFGHEQRLALVRGAVMMYAMARIANMVLNHDKGIKGGHWDPEDAFTLVTPKSWGPNWGGKAISMRTVYGDVARLIEDPKAWTYNRLNPVTLRPTIEFLTGRDNFGRKETSSHFFKEYGKQVIPIPAQKLVSTSDEGLIEGFFTAFGANMANYRTPLEKYARKLRVEAIPDKPEDEEKMAESRRNTKLVEQLRDGRATTTDLWNLVNKGQLTAREAANINERAGMTELQYDVSHMQDFDDALKVWDKANAEERAEISEVLEAKAERRIENVGKDNPFAADELEAKLTKMGVLKPVGQ